MAEAIYFGGVEMPTPKSNGGLVETYEDVWSANTGRNGAGEMVGTLVATKAKLKLSWNALTWAQAATIKNAIYGKGFTTCTYPSVDGSQHTIRGYFGTPSFSQYSWAEGLRWATAISVNFIEQ
jgi:hypothetical protein